MSNVRPQKQAMLRAAIIEDRDAIVRVLMESRRVFLPYALSPHTEEEMRGWVAKDLIPSGGVTVVLSRAEVVAVLVVSEDEHFAWIDQLYVLPGFENHGLGSRLLSFAHQSVKGPIRLFTFQQNAGARRFYERHDYRVVMLTDGKNNEEKCPDVLYEFNAKAEA